MIRWKKKCNPDWVISFGQLGNTDIEPEICFWGLVSVSGSGYCQPRDTAGTVQTELHSTYVDGTSKGRGQGLTLMVGG